MLPRVATAHELMHRVVDLQNRINQLTTQFAAKTEKKSKRHPVLYAIAGFLIAFALITSTPAEGGHLPVHHSILHDGRHGASGDRVERHQPCRLRRHRRGPLQGHREVRRQEPRPEERRHRPKQRPGRGEQPSPRAKHRADEAGNLHHAAALAAEVAPWYPMDYDSIDAVDFFLTAVRNHRASTVQEMVNLYETERHQRRMEQGQQQILQQQRIGNMLQLGNLFMQGQILNQAQQINANTASASSSLDWISNAMGRR